ncbi:hypothetical protein HPP92_011847 [Vanilla planifolia]|uniref:Uncharacterized protein n=1 Tax=Vanilla planifolia TaxID=51239 RepID=A0A835R2L3_VANPL|nr:hypothetical protein HPP92_011847 [Vanilla planifolia]
MAKEQKMEKIKKVKMPIVAKQATTNMNRTKRMKEKKKAAQGGCRKKSGPHLPSSFLKELGFQKHPPNTSEQEEGEEDDDNLYEYEEPLPEEEMKKNRRFDQVENYEYELPKGFEDEDVPSDEGEDVPIDEDEVENDSEKHVRMLQSITGLPAAAFKGMEKRNVALTDVQSDLGGKITVHDLLDPLHGKTGYSMLRKRLNQLEKAPMAVQSPLPKVEREKLERKVTYEQSKKEISKWDPLVKRNREAPSLYFAEDIDLGVSTVGAIAAEHEPRTEFEKKMAALVGNPDIMEAHMKDGGRLLELNKVSVEDVKLRHNRLAKMRNLLFRHEIRAKHIKKIKSKTYHRILKKERQKTASSEMNMNPEAAKEAAIRQEFKRAERGLKAQDEGTRAAIAEQLHQHALLKRKMNSINDNSSSDESTDEDSDKLSPGSDGEGVARLLNKAKEKTMKLMEEEEEMPKSGVFALPFMHRGLKKQREEAYEEAHRALEEYECSLKSLDGEEAECQSSPDKNKGRRIFTGPKSQLKVPSTKEPNCLSGSDSEGDFEEFREKEEHTSEIRPNFQVQSALLPSDAETGQEKIFKNFDDVVKNPGSKTTYEVAIFASDSWKKMGGENSTANDLKNTAEVHANNVIAKLDSVERADKSDSDSDIEMVDGLLTSEHVPSYKLPSQDVLIHRAFAGDDVEAEFEKDKMDALNEEIPEPEKPVLLPGWGQWTHVQKKKGIPSILLEEHEREKRKREDSLKTRKDANLKHVFISEKVDKKTEKLHAKNLPFPYTSKEVYEHSIRMPIGPDYNPVISIGALNRPAVIKRAGVIIEPIKYEEIDPYGNSEAKKKPTHSSQKPKNTNKAKLAGRKTNNKS